MAGDPLSDVGQNDPFVPSASTHNAWNEAARWVRARRPGMKSVTTNDLSPVTVWVQNDTAFDRDRFDVMGIIDTLVTPSENETQFTSAVAFSCRLPAGPEAFEGG